MSGLNRTKVTSLWCLVNELSCFLILPTSQRRINDKARTPTYCPHHPTPKFLYTHPMLMAFLSVSGEEMHIHVQIKLPIHTLHPLLPAHPLGALLFLPLPLSYTFRISLGLDSFFTASQWIQVPAWEPNEVK